jgi:ferrous iron transport protein A
MKPDLATGDFVAASTTAAAADVAMAAPGRTDSPPACAPCCVVCPLSDLARGGCARVVSLAGAPRLQRRLMALGLRPSAELAVLGRAPGNGPLELRAGTVHLMLRACEARDVMVEVDDTTNLRPPAHPVPADDAHVLPTV